MSMSAMSAALVAVGSTSPFTPAAGRKGQPHDRTLRGMEDLPQ